MRQSAKRRITQEIKFLTPEETHRLYRVISCDCSNHAIRNRAAFFIAKYCALRASEVGLIRMSDYNIVSHTIYCRRVKGSKSNTIKIVDPEVIDFLDAHYSQRIQIDPQNPYLFPSQKGSPLNRRSLDNLIKGYGAQINLDVTKRHFHVLKHTRAMELINYSGIHLRDVQWWLGHKSINNTMIYLEYTSKAQEELFARIAEVEGMRRIYADKTP